MRLKKYGRIAVTGLLTTALAFGLLQPVSQSAGFTLRGGIGAKATALGEKTVGKPTSAEICGKGICYQSFSSGTQIVWSAATGAQALQPGAVKQKYVSLGFPFNGVTGLPTSDLRRGLREGGQWQSMQRGAIFNHPSLGAHAVSAGMWGGWSRFSRENGALGFPASGEYRSASGDTAQNFQRGRLYWNASQGTRAVFGGIFTAYTSLGADRSFLGKPSSEEIRIPGGVKQLFAGGAFYSVSGIRTREVHGTIWGRYTSLGAERGRLGLPLSNEYAFAGGSRQDFQGGTVIWTSRTGAVLLEGAMKSRFLSSFAELGLPTGNATALQGGQIQSFAKADLVWSPQHGSRILDHQTFDSFRKNQPVFGWPTADSAADPRGSRTAFTLRSTVARNGFVFDAARTADKVTALHLCDSQCDNYSWTRQGSESVGMATTMTYAYGGGGYAASAGVLGMSPTDALVSNKILLPSGDPGLIILTFGGNDASQGKTNAQVLSGLRTVTSRLKAMYPKTRIVVNGVMSTSAASHERRRAIDAVVTAEARRLGLPTVSVAGWVTKYRAPLKDHVHLLQSGHDIIAKPYSTALRAALK